MKKHSLVEHWNDITEWWCDVFDPPFMSEDEKNRAFFIAYERWLNDRELLTVEDGYEWKSEPAFDGRRAGSLL